MSVNQVCIAFAELKKMNNSACYFMQLNKNGKLQT